MDSQLHTPYVHTILRDALSTITPSNIPLRQYKPWKITRFDPGPALIHGIHMPSGVQRVYCTKGGGLGNNGEYTRFWIENSEQSLLNWISFLSKDNQDQLKRQATDLSFQGCGAWRLRLPIVCPTGTKRFTLTLAVQYTRAGLLQCVIYLKQSTTTPSIQIYGWISYKISKIRWNATLWVLRPRHSEYSMHDRAICLTAGWCMLGIR